MRKFTPLALLLGLLSALLLGGAGVAQAGAADVVCKNKQVGGVNVVVCDVIDDVTGVKIGDITIKNIKVLNNNEINALQTAIVAKVGDILSGNKTIVVVIVKDVLNIDIDVKDVTICVINVGVVKCS